MTEVIDLSHTKSTGTHTSGGALSWRNLKYFVPDLKQPGACNGMFNRNKVQKEILKGVAGHVPVGEMVAIMGPSGCGKSTLLDVLAGRKKSRNTSGEVLFNGQPIDHALLKKRSAYVLQDDALNGVLTVYQNIWYAAMFKLPNTMTHREKEERVDEVINELGLAKVRDSLVGNWAFRGVSGGERRRVSIAMELITRPSLLILDEPTSGLDALTAKMLVENLRDMAKAHNCVVIMTIHQPSSYVFQLFHAFCLLSEGRQIFFGRPSDCIKMWGDNKIKLPDQVNPSDFFIETVNVNFNDKNIDSFKVLDDLSSMWWNSPYAKALDAAITSNQGTAIQPARVKEKCCGISYTPRSEKYNTTFMQQTYYLSHRFFWAWLRDPGVFWARVVMYTLLALMMGTEFIVQSLEQSTIQDRISILFFSCAFLVFMSVAAIPAFLEEKTIFERERANGYFSVGPYALANTLVSAPFVFSIAVFFSVTCYFLMYMAPGVEQFFYFLINLGLTLLVAEAVVSVIASLVPSMIVGIAVGAGLWGMFMLNQGFFLRQDHIPGWWIWVHYIVVHKYSFEGFMKNEFENQVFQCQNVTTALNTTECFCNHPDLNGNCLLEGTEILAYYGYQDVPKWWWLLVITAMLFFFRFVFYLSLRYCNKAKK